MKCLTTQSDEIDITDSTGELRCGCTILEVGVSKRSIRLVWGDEAREGRGGVLSGDLGSKAQLVWLVTGKERRFGNELSGSEYFPFDGLDVRP